MSDEYYLDPLELPAHFSKFPFLVGWKGFAGLPSSLALWGSVSGHFEWLYETSEAIENRLGEGAAPLVIRKALQEAFARDAIAYATMQAVRIHELVASSLSLAANWEVVSAAGSARSALESSLAVWLVAKRWAEAFPGDDPARWQQEKVEMFNDFLPRAIWGGRAAYRTQKSIAVKTPFDKYEKQADEKDVKTLKHIYDELSDILHPSAAGHQFYWHGAHENVDIQAPIHITIDARLPNHFIEDALLAILWAVDFSSRTTVNAYIALRDSTPPGTIGTPQWWGSDLPNLRGTGP